jgi:aminoglycoside 6'-N-acetyltransferase I
VLRRETAAGCSWFEKQSTDFKMTSGFVVHRPVRLGDSVDLAAGIRALFEVGVTEGPLAVLGRPSPADDALALWIGAAPSPAAFATFMDAGDGRAWLDILFVKPELRRQGAATALIEAVGREAASQGFRHLLTGTMPDNEAMQRLALRLGFVQTAIVYGKAVAP